MSREGRGWQDPRKYPDFGVAGVTLPKEKRLAQVAQRHDEAERIAREQAEAAQRAIEDRCPMPGPEQ